MSESSIKLALHASAASSTPHSLLWNENNEVLYASHGVLNIANDFRVNTVRSASIKATINCISRIKSVNRDLVALGYNDGSVSIWDMRTLTEEVVVGADSAGIDKSVVALEGLSMVDGTVFLVTSCPLGLRYHLKRNVNWETSFFQQNFAFNCLSVNFLKGADNDIVILAGSAAPHGNRIRAYSCNLNKKDYVDINFQGSLLGHQDWIGCLAWRSLGSGHLLASGSHDHKIRLWYFNDMSSEGNPQTTSNINDTNNGTDLNLGDDDYDEGKIDDLLEGEARLVLKLSDGHNIGITLEAMLIGHEDIVTDIKWKPSNQNDTPCLLSSSMDRCIIIWKSEEHEKNVSVTGDVWSPIARVGIAGGLLGGSIGSSLLGFVGASWSPDGNRIVGHGYGGALYFWSAVKQNRGNKDDNDELDGIQSEVWKADRGMTGHFGAVEDCCWEPSQGLYLLSASADQTCRLWAAEGGGYHSNGTLSTWHEVARPQVHGYNLKSLSSIGLGRSNGGEPLHRFVSGADEKQLRVFDAPLSTLKLLKQLSIDCEIDNEDRIYRAYIPSLGLSNNGEAANEIDEFKIDSSESRDKVALPGERELGVNTLWPEVGKLFGHDTEILCTTSTSQAYNKYSDDRILLASACKARDVDNASIRLWDVASSKCISVLKGGHKASVSTLSFSPNHAHFLASSGKDRRLCIWGRHNVQDSVTYNLVAAVDSAHKRIIWSCHFCPFEDGLLATGSRDGTVKVWSIIELCPDEEYSQKSEFSLNEQMSFEPASKNEKASPITAVAFAPQRISNSAILALGLESGTLELWRIPLNQADQKPTLINVFPTNLCHTAAVRKIVWRPASNDSSKQSDKAMLASCSLDHGVRIFELSIPAE